MVHLCASAPYLQTVVSLTSMQLHPEPVPSAQERYAQEIRRVYKVIDSHLARTKRQWLVGDRICYADIMFQSWNEMVPIAAMNDEFLKEWERDMPHCWAWYQRLRALPSAVKAREFAMAAMASGKHWAVEDLDANRNAH
jgi:glutathione S-transferase